MSHLNAQTHQLLRTISTRLQSLLRPPLVALCVAGSMFSTSSVLASDAELEALKKVLQGQIELMKPELRKKVEGLSTDTKMSLMAILAMHSRYSDKATLRQVMLEVMMEYQTIAMGIMTDNTEMTADAARRLANHRIPVGGLLPYMGLENINDERLGLLDGFNTSVEGNSNKLADAAQAGDLATAAALLGEVTTGCVGCHAVFRTLPGKSDLLK